MFYLIALLLVGVNLSCFAFERLNIWQAQGFYTQVLILLCFCYSFFERPKQEVKRNIPLMCLLTWLTCQTMFHVYTLMTSNTPKLLMGFYALNRISLADIKVFLPIFKDIQIYLFRFAHYFNFLTLILFYRIVQQYLDKDKIRSILNILRYVLIYSLLLCGLQQLGLAQFFNFLPGSMIHKFGSNLDWSPVVGLIGNGTHLSGFLAMLIPLLFWKFKRVDKWAIALLICILFTTGTLRNDPSISGFIIVLILAGYYFKTNVKFISGYLLILSIILIITFRFLPSQFLFFEDRLQLFELYLPHFKKLPLTGQGLSIINILRHNTLTPEGQHLHFELLQFTLELGLIGLAIILALLKQFIFSRAEDRTQLTLKAIVLGFLISSCFNYPAHLWLPSLYVMFTYSSYHLLNKGVRNAKNRICTNLSNPISSKQGQVQEYNRRNSQHDREEDC